MNSAKFRDYTLSICAIIFVLIFTLSNLYGIFSLSSIFSDMKGFGQSDLGIISSCEYRQDRYILSINLDNYAADYYNNIDCKIVDSFGLIAAEKQQSIKELPPGSSDICSFDLSGDYTKPVRVEVTYNGKTVRQAVECYTYPESGQ